MTKYPAAPHLGGPGKVTLGRRGTARERFMVKVAEQPNGCWLWLGSRNERGYALFTSEAGRTVRAHRWAYSEFAGNIPDGMTVDHLCDNRSCVNPAHLALASREANWRRWYENASSA